MTSAAHIDLYQLTSLVPHFDADLAELPVTLTFFSRRLPTQALSGTPARGYLLWIGLRRCLDYLERAHFSEEALRILGDHPALGPALGARPALVDLLRRWRFNGEIHSPPEGTPILAGAALRPDGTPLAVEGVQPAAYCPYLVVHTDLLSAKLIETPLLSTINHMTMVASKAARVVRAAGDRGVLEFGTRRTHGEAAIDAALAAWMAGCMATSNVEAHLRHGVPIAGTMDHFAVQAWERPGTPRHETERAYFEAFYRSYPGSSTLLVDTYDTFGARTGIRNAVEATGGRGPAGIRLDSSVNRESIWRARRLLDSLGARHTRIIVSSGIDEAAIEALGDAPVDGFGVGERIVTSPDAPVGVGAVAKLSEIGGRPTMKWARGTGKASLPGALQCWRSATCDVVGLRGERREGVPLLQPVWDREEGRLPGPEWSEIRDFARHQLNALPEDWHSPRQVQLPVSSALAALVERLVSQGQPDGH